MEWATIRLKDLPNSDESLKAYAMDVLNKEERERGWDDLVLDWSEYHPRAREILNDLFFWDCLDDLAPHGNDDGADLLERFKRWRKKSPSGESKTFFDRLMREWGVSNGREIVTDDIYDCSAIALAFAHLKIDAACPKWAQDEALKALTRRRQALKEVMHEELSMGKLKKIEDVLVCATEL